jgi:hypothetical protein
VGIKYYHLCGQRYETNSEPIPMVQNPVVLVGEDHQSSWYTLPAIVFVTRSSHGVKGLYSLLQRMERANPIRLGQTIVLATVNHELRRRPLVHEVYRVKPFEQIFRILVPRSAAPFVVELCSKVIETDHTRGR